MSQSRFSLQAPPQRRLLFLGVFLVVITGLWLAVGNEWKVRPLSHAVTPAGSGRDVSKVRKRWSATVIRIRKVSPRQEGQALSVLGNGKQTVDERNQHDKRLADVRQRALALAVDPNITLTVRVTALSIAGDGGGTGGEVANRWIAASREPTPAFLSAWIARADRPSVKLC